MKKKIIYLLIFLVVLAPYFIEEKVLLVEEAANEEIIYQQHIKQGAEFAIKYIHSVEKTPVWDYFKVTEEDILLTSTKYMSYGAGLPFLKKNNYIVENDRFIIKEIDTKLEQIPLRVSDYAKHELVVNDESHQLYQLTKTQNLVLIKVEDKNLYQLGYVLFFNF